MSHKLVLIRNISGGIFTLSDKSPSITDAGDLVMPEGTKIIGNPGTKGDTGATGPEGPEGPAGPQGKKGRRGKQGNCPPNCLLGPSFTAGHNYSMGEDLTNCEGDALILNNNKVYKSRVGNDKRVIGYLGEIMNGILSITNETTDNIARVISIGDSYEWTSVEDLDADGNLITIKTKTGKGVKVCNENGNIETGDLLTTSSREGYLMKQADDIIHSYSAARSMEEITFSTEISEKIEVYCIMLCG